MRQTMNPIDTPDRRFKDGNPATGEYGTVVTAEHLNNVQDSVMSMQNEIITVLNEAGMTVNPNDNTQLWQALQVMSGQVESIEALRAFEPLRDKQVAFVKGYYANSSVGGGFFIADFADTDSTDNGGTVIVTNGGKRWKRVVLNNCLQVADFGVIGDGQTDDTLALSRFLNVLRETKNKGLFAARKYKISAPLNIAGIEIEGVLAGYKNKYGTQIIGNGNHTLFEQGGVKLKDITYSLKNFHLSQGSLGLKMSYAINCQIENIFIDEVNTAFVLGLPEVVGPIWNLFKNCRGEARQTGLIINGKSWANANSFDTCFFKGGDAAARINAQSGIGAIANHFINTEFAGEGYGVVLMKNKSTTFDNCYFESHSPALLIEGATADLTLDNCVFGSLTQNNKMQQTAFIYHTSGAFNFTINSGYIYLSGKNQNDLTFADSEKPDLLVMNMQSPVKREIYGVTGFKLFRHINLPNNYSRIQFTDFYRPDWTLTPEMATEENSVVVNDGELTAFYTLNNSRCTVNINIKIGNETQIGEGNWHFALPIKSSAIGKYYLGQALAIKPGLGNQVLKMGIARIVGSSRHLLVYFDNINPAGKTRPFQWQEGDRLDISISYEI